MELYFQGRLRLAEREPERAQRREEYRAQPKNLRLGRGVAGADAGRPLKLDSAFENAAHYLERKLAAAQRRNPRPQRQEAGILAPDLNERLAGRLDAGARALRRLGGDSSPNSTLFDTKRSGAAYATLAGCSAFKGANALAKAWGATEATEIAGAVAIPLALPSAAMCGYGLARDAIELGAGCRPALRSMTQHLEGARRFFAAFQEGKVDAAAARDAHAFLQFMARAKKIPALNAAARQARIQANTAAARSTAVDGCAATISGARVFGGMAHALSAASAASLGVAGGVTSVVQGSLHIFQGQYDYDRYHAAKNAVRRKQEAAQESLRAQLDRDSYPMLAQIHRSYQHNLERLHRQGVRERRFALSRIVRGTGEIGTGLATGAAGIAALCGVTAASAGIAIAVAAAAVSTVYLAGVASRLYLKWKAEHTSKRRQRQAQALIETHGERELRALFLAGREKTLAMFRSQSYHEGGCHPGFADARYKSVDVATNEYLALHLLAQDLVRLACGGPGAGRGAHEAGAMACEFLRLLGMDGLELAALVCALPEVKAGERAEYVKKMIAPLFGVPFRVAADGHERPAAPAVYFHAARRAFLECGISWKKYASGRGRGGRALDREALHAEVAGRLFARVERDRFCAAIDALRASRKPAQEDTPAKRLLEMVGALADWASAHPRQA